MTTFLRSLFRNRGYELKNEANFTFVSWNIDGIINKLDDPYFIDYISKFMIVCLFETFVDNIDLTEYFPGYECCIAPAHKLSAHGRRSGGTVCMIKQNISSWFKQLHISCSSAVAFKVDKTVFGTHRDILFVSVYIPPTGSTFCDNKDGSDGIVLLQQALLEVLVYNDGDIILFGYLNI